MRKKKKKKKIIFFYICNLDLAHTVRKKKLK
jgi:hypothetical protein